MNLLEITAADIERLKENKIVFGLLPERDREILRCVDTGNVDRYCHSGFYRCKKGGSFDPCAVYRIIAGYQLPAPTEDDIIAYLKASEVAPSQWHPAAQEWARRHNGRGIWQYKEFDKWTDSGRIYGYDGKFYTNPHRLRADYGRKDAGYVEFTDPPKSINPSDVSYGPFTLEPEVCVWKKHCDANTCYTDPHGELCFMPIKDINKGRFCPVCGKRIETRNKP